MSKLVHEVSKRIIAVALSIAMIMSNMTVYAAESGQVITEEGYIETSSENDGAEDAEVKETADSDETKVVVSDDDSAETEMTEDDAMPQENGKDVLVSDDEETEEADEDTEDSDTVEKSDKTAVDNKDGTVSAFPTTWIFRGSDHDVEDVNNCTGLTIGGGHMFSPTAENGDYLSIGGTNQSINIKVGKPCDITVEYHQNYILAEIGIDDDTIAFNSSGNTTYKYRGDGEATVTIKNTDSSNRAYISKITITAPPATVGVPTTWIFRGSDHDVTDVSDCKGLTIGGGHSFSPTAENGDYLSIGGTNQSINLNVGEPCDITVEYHQNYILAEVGVGSDTVAFDSSGSVTYKYRGKGEATVSIKNTDSGNRAYISKITISESSVGSGVEVALSGQGLSLHDLSGVELVFTDNNDSNSETNRTTYYVGDDIQPGSSTYTVELDKNNSYVQGVELSLKGADGDGKLSDVKAGDTITISYTKYDSSKNVKEWTLENSDFVKSLGTSASDAVSCWYQGLKLDKVYKNNTYLYVSSGGSVKIPVNSPSIVTATCYPNSAWANGTLEGVGFDSTTWSATYKYMKDEEGYVELKSTGNLDLIRISIKDVEEDTSQIANSFTLDFYDIVNTTKPKEGDKVVSNIDGLTINNFTYFASGNNHGIRKGNNASMKFNLKQNAYLIVTTCTFVSSGSITSDSNAVTVVPLGNVTVNGESAPQYFVRMSGVNKDEGETITLNFNINYLHKIELVYVDNDNYVVTVNSDENGIASADEQIVAVGDKVTLTAEPKDVSYKLKEWEVVSEGSFKLSDEDKVKNPLEITMPAEDVEIKAIFEESGVEKPVIADSITIDFYAKASGHTAGEAVKSDVEGLVINDFTWFDSSNNHGIRRGNNASMEFNLKQKAYLVVTTCSFVNSGDITSDSDTVTVVPLGKVDINSDKGAPQYFVRADEGEVVLKFTVGYVHKIELVYVEDDNYVVTVSDNGNGSASAEPKFAAADEKVTLTAAPDDRYDFSAWEAVEGIELTNAQKSTNPLEITMPANEVEIKAIFEPTVRREWDFVNDETLIGDNGRTVEQGQTATVAKLGIDATANGSGWDSKVTVGGDGAVAKNGTKITILLESIYSNIEIAAETKDYKVNGKAAGSAKDTFECESEEKTVVIEMTADNHIQSIKVTPVYYAAEGLHDFTPKDADFKVDGFEFTKFTDQDNSHGFAFSDGATIKLNLRKNANISVLTCGFGSNQEVTMTSSSKDDLLSDPVSEAGLSNKGMRFTVLNAQAGDVTLTFAKSSWIHYIIIEYIEEIEPGTRNIDVWDFGGKAENNTTAFRYNNNITANDLTEIAPSGTFKAGPAYFGNLTMYPAEKDKLDTGTAAQHAYGDYTAAGMWSGSNAGSSTSRYVEVKLQAGDKLIAYMGSSGSGDIEFIFEGQIGALGDTDSVTIASGKYEKCVFTANKTGVYKVYATGKGKPAYHRFMRIPGVGVSGTLDFKDCNITTDYTVKFKNLTTKKDTFAKVNNDNSFNAVLAPGYTYRAVLSGAKGFGFTTDSSSVEVKDENYKNGISGKTLVIETKEVYEYSGTIVGFASDYERISDIKVTMIADEDSESEDEPLAITQSGNDITFTAKLDPLTEYTFKLEGVNDYEIIEPDKVCNDDDGIYTGQTIKVALKSMYDVTGGFQDLPVSDTVKVNKLTFTNLEDEYVYEADINEDGKGYSVQLRDGEYVAAAEVADYSTSTHVIVDGGAVSKDLLFVFTGTKDKTEYVEKIYVGYTDDRENNYATVSEAMEACRLMNRSNPSGERITVSIAPGEYREQIIVDVPYVSFINESKKEVLLTWYYGIGYKYYSADAKGYYNPENAYDKYDKHTADRWGVAVYVKSAATGFRADGITFENSFNRYITDEELADGVEVSGTESITVVRNYNTDVTSNAATERAAAIAVEADQAEFNNCGFYSSQDTLYTQGGHIYFKNCVMEGETDYIYGSGNCVFDACELSRKGYSDKESGGYITANSPNAGEKGYLFRNCTITANHYNKLKVGEGYFGRPWNQDATVIFMNTKLQSVDLMKAEGWHDMNDATAVNANFWEYNTTTITGTAVDTSKRVRGVMTKEEANAVNVTDYFGEGWTPYYYVAEEGTPAVEGNMSVTNNGDINAPHPGNTLTVHYSLGAADQYDASKITWYIVDSPDAETGELVKTSVATVDKTYQIDMEAEGKYIRVTVTPETFSGTIGEPKSFTVEQVVREGWNDPTGGGDITLGDGVNIFLAGDSTVMDYSAKGMYNGGKPLNTGSWGEFIQAFFNEDQVTIQNYAQGGRSSRTFINEGKLDNIKTNMSKGDYLFIQFGHNDCADEPEYIERYVPVGTKDANGIYPTTPGEKDSSGEYPNTSGTFKWYLKQYIDAAREKGATPVLVTPVARMYYTSDGKIRTHHDDSTSSNDAYVTAMKQLADEENVLLIDGFEMTKALFEEAWTADGNNNNTYGLQIMGENEDTTHNNKLGGVIEAALIAGAIQDMNLNISKVVKAPTQVLGATIDETTVFSINKSGELTAYDIHSGYANKAPYWEKIGQAMFDAIGEKADELGGGSSDEKDTVSAPTANIPSGTSVRPNTEIKLYSATVGAEIYYTLDGTTTPSVENGARYTTPITFTDDTTIKAIAVKDGYNDSEVVTFMYTVSENAASVYPPTANIPTGTEVESGTEITLLCVPEDAEIYYTLDGTTTPSETTGKLYENPIVITVDTTIIAVAVKNGETSDPSTFVYTVKDDGNDSNDSDKEKDPVVITLDECEVVAPSVIRKKETDPIKPETYVTYKGYCFVAGLDYAVSENVSGPDSDGYYSVTLTGLERDNNGRMEETYKIAESPTKEVKFKVVSAPKKGDTSVVDFSKAKVSLDASAKTAVYTGSVIEPKLDADPKKDKDGLVTKLGDRINYAYKNNINAGKATVTISVKPPKPTDEDQTIYAGSKTFTFNIKKAALNKNQDKATAKVVYEDPDNLDYKGNGVGIELKSCRVTVGTAPNTVELKKDRDYTVTYKNNAKAGKATVTVKGIGNNVSGSWSTTYTITALKLEELTINAADQTMYYSPKGAKLGTITAKKGSDTYTYTLKEGTDFTAKYVYGEKTKAAGTDVEVTISGKNGCTGKNIAIEGKIKIAQADFEKCITVSSDVVLDKTTKTGKEQAALAKTLAVTDTSGAKLKLDKDYKMTLKTDEKTNAPIVVIEPKDETNSNYKGSKTVPYRVAANLAKEKTFVMDKNLEKTDPLGYDGRNPVQITQREIDEYINNPNLAKDPAGTTYTLGTNIRIVPGTYKNNTKKGTAQVTVQGIGELYGTKVLKFKIAEK